MSTNAQTVSVDAYSPAEIARKVDQVGVKKAKLPLLNTLLLAVLAGAFIALGAIFAIVASTGSELGFGPTKVLAGTVFSLGLILVVVAGAELFTGNNLVAMAWASGNVSTAKIIRNWILVYLGNFIGAVSTALLVYWSGIWKADDFGVGWTALKIAHAKSEISFVEGIFRGVMCNALVCLAVWLCQSGRSTMDKIFATIWPIAAFVAIGFEHSVANMFFLPFGIFLRNDGEFTSQSALDDPTLLPLEWSDVWTNLLPVTIGNIIGGTLLVAGVYWLVYLRPKSD